MAKRARAARQGGPQTTTLNLRSILVTTHSHLGSVKGRERVSFGVLLDRLAALHKILEREALKAPTGPAARYLREAGLTVPE